MKLREVSGLISDKAIVYKQVSDSMDFIDLYKGYLSGIPSNMADMEVRTIGAAKKGVVDIHVN